MFTSRVSPAACAAGTAPDAAKVSPNVRRSIIFRFSIIGLLCFVLAILASPFKSKLRLEAENAVLRHQLIVLKRRLRGRVRLTNNDRWFFVQLYRWFPSILKVLTIIRPETLARWHRAGAFAVTGVGSRTP